MENAFLNPALDAGGKAMVVPDLDTHRALSPAGEHKPMSMYWIRRIRDGDVVVAEPPKPVPPPIPAIPAMAPIAPATVKAAAAKT